ncbi:MAG: AI-2E family transporter [Armatimonadota bacterium]|nr:AI-2E family transporter [Armatimonadota bacterium]
MVFLAAMVLNPAVTALEERGLKRALAVVLVLLLLLGLGALDGWLMVPPILEQTEQLTQRRPIFTRVFAARRKAGSSDTPFWSRLYPTIRS